MCAPYRDLAPEVDLMGPMPYADFQCMLDDPPGHPATTGRADYHDDFPDDAVDVFVKAGFGRQSPLAQQLLLPGVATWPVSPEAATPMTKRDAPWITHPFAVWERPAETEPASRGPRTFRRDIAHYSNGGVYLNFIGDEGQERVRSAYGEDKYRDSRASRPNGIQERVRGNQNIEPA